MKTKCCWVLLLILAVAAIPVFAEQGKPLASPAPITGFSIKNDVSAPLRDMAKAYKPAGTSVPPREIPIHKVDRSKWVKPAPLSRDPLLGTMIPRGPMPTPIITFEGGSDAQNQTIVGTRYVPPDTNGDVGPNHYFQYINTLINIYDKSTGVELPGFPVAGNALWSGFGGLCQTTDQGDPTVIYDQFTGRWVATQFVITSGIECVAVSATGDPAGAYNRYAFNVGAWNDYPKIANWSDGYYLTFNYFPGGGSFSSVVAVAFEKSQMILGAPAQMILFPVVAPAGPGCGGAGDCYFSLQPAHADGLTAPPAGEPNYFVMAFDDESWFNGVPDPSQDFYKIWQFHADWTTPANSTFTGPVSLPSPEFDANLCNYGACIPQLGGEVLDTLSQFTMYRASYRNFGGIQSMYVSSSVNVGGNRGGVRWAQINSPADPVLYQAGTQAPDDGLSRWMGSINSDKDGNIAVGYSVSSSGMYPSIRYAGRLAGDALGTLPQTETELFAGTGSQISSSNRWGDYSSMSIDKSDDCTFWYTQEYYQTTASFQFNTRIGSFKFPSCTNGPTGTLAGTVTTAGSGAPIAGAQIQIGTSYSTSTDASGHYSITIPVGTYDVTASHFGYASQTANGVVVSDGQTTTQDFSLTPNASITVDGFVTDGSGGGMPLYADVNVSSAAGTFDVFTNPANGYYSFSAFVGTNYTVTVNALIAGYDVATRNFTTGTTDLQENFALTVNQASCNAPGYTIQSVGVPITADFSGGVPPAGWTVANVTTNCSGSVLGWAYPDPEGHSNITGGSGPFASANSDYCGPSVHMDTTLTSPNIDLTTFSGGTRINFNSDYNDLCSAAAGSAVTVDIWNGSAWSTVHNFCGETNKRGPRLESFVTTAGDGAMSKVRFRYIALWDWWWAIDNVSISASACVFTNGGLIYGNVTDLNTGLAVNGATVSLDTGQTTTSGPTPGDSSIGDGFYYIYAPTQTSSIGTRIMTVSKTNYGTITRSVVPTPRGSVREDFALPAGRFNVVQTEMRKRLPIGGSGDSTLLLNNTGTLAATFNLIELNVPPPQARPNGPFDKPVYPFDEHTKLGYKAAIARNAQNVPHGILPNVPTYPKTGEYVNSFPSNLGLPWGAGFDTTGSKFWASNLGIAVGQTNADWQYNPDGTQTGTNIPTDSAGGSWAGDMAYVALTNKLWQVNVGGNNCIFEIDAASNTITGNKICPAFGTSMRGLAYDSGSNHFYAGTWNGNFIMEFATDASIVRTVNVGLPISGLAFNATTHHLFAQVNDANQKVYILDAAQASLPILGSIDLKDSSGGEAFLQYDGAGLEMDCAGNLWSVNQGYNSSGNARKVFVNNTGESGACSVDIPWLSEDPTSGTVPAGGSATSDFTFTTAGQNPGCQEAQVLVTNNTPYGTPDITVALTTQFNDVPLGSFGDFFIHGIAGAGISYGCGAGNFCPNDDMTRRLMPVWLLRGKFGRFYQPPPAVGIFADVSPESFAADWIEDLYNRGITGGCGTNPLIYCPDTNVTRAQMAVFLLRTKDGSSYTPPTCQGIFSDMSCSDFFTPWAEELYNRGITAGCSTSPLMYCPANPTPRSQMSIFESRTFGIPACKQ